MVPPPWTSISRHHGNTHPQAALRANPMAPAGLRSTLINDSYKINELAPASASTSLMRGEGGREAIGARLLLKSRASSRTGKRPRGGTAANPALETVKSTFLIFSLSTPAKRTWMSENERMGTGGNRLFVPPCLQKAPALCSGLFFLGTG